MESDSRNMPFIKNLASSDRKMRTTALLSLRNFLSARQVSSSLSQTDIQKLWKGLFYAMWMCDRPLPQQALAQDLAELIYVLPDKNEKAVVAWLRGFWSIMAREWTGIDVLRMDKFLMLVRRVVGASLGWMKMREDKERSEELNNGGKKRGKDGKEKKSGNGKKEGKKTTKWHKKRADAIIGVLGEYPFVLEADAKRKEEEGESAFDDEEDEDKSDAEEVEEKKDPAFVPVGLKIHVLDIWVDEAEKVGLIASPKEEGDDEKEGETEEEEEDEEAKAIVHRITQLVDELEKGTTSPAVRIRAKQSLLDDRLPWNKTTVDGEDDEDMEE